MAQTRKNRILPLILVLVCAAVMLRSAFTGLEIDEEYALSLGYRLVSGDRLFYDMWEPHQLSSLPAAALLAMFIGITGGTTGVLVFFRLVVLACKAGMSCVFYREFRRDLGKPAALLLLAKNATVTICHSKTKNLKEVCAAADILVAAVGREGFVTGDMVKPGAVVIDVGINRGADGKLHGDVNFAEAGEKAGYITPVPGGVGPMTRAMLMKNTTQAAAMQNGVAI